MTPLARALGITAGLALAACHGPKPLPLVKRAAFGVLFGGQIQERREIPFELDGAKQTLGFAVEFNEPLRAGVDVTWDVDKPKPKAKAKPRKHAQAENVDPKPISGRETARAGETRFEQVLRLEPGDPLGRWNVRVTVGADAVVDRPFDVYDPKDRNGEIPDGG